MEEDFQWTDGNDLVSDTGLLTLICEDQELQIGGRNHNFCNTYCGVNEGQIEVSEGKKEKSVPKTG